MTFTPKAFTNGAVLSALDLNEMDGNDDHIRSEANIYYLVSDAAPGLLTDTGTLKLYIDGVQFGLTQTGVGSKSEGDINISSLAAGIHILKFGGNNPSAQYRIFKSQDMSYLTYWAKIGASIYDPNFAYEIIDITVLGHRLPMAWA